MRLLTVSLMRSKKLKILKYLKNVKNRFKQREIGILTCQISSHNDSLKEAVVVMTRGKLVAPGKCPQNSVPRTHIGHNVESLRPPLIALNA